MKHIGIRCRCNGLYLAKVGNGVLHGPQTEHQKSQFCCQKDEYGVIPFNQLLESQSDIFRDGNKKYQMIPELAKLRPVAVKNPENLYGEKVL